jgi:predicted nucleic acid-binding protein
VAYLLDTNLLVRLANGADSQHPIALQAVLRLHRRGEVLHVTPQVMIEFRNVATRPAAQNGLGLSTVDAETQASGYEQSFPLLADTPDIYPAWKSLVQAGGVIGKQVHDARIVAVCRVHSITNLLTFNVAHITRLASLEPGLTVVDPSSV